MGYSRNPLEGEKLRKALRENLRRFRTEAGYSQGDVARLLGMNRATYTYYETGKTTPSVVDLYHLSQLYRRCLEEFFRARCNMAAGPFLLRVFYLSMYSRT